MRNRLVQIALSLAFLGLLIQIVLIAPSQIRDAATKAELDPLPDMSRAQPQVNEGADQSIKGMHMIETQNGGKEWELWSEKAVSLKAREVLQLDNVKTVFFSDRGVTFTVTGNHGTVQTKTKDLRVEGNVVTRSSNGYVFRTERLDYQSNERLLSTPDAVEMIGPRDADGQSLHLTGVGVKASLVNTTMEVLSEVRAEKRLEKGRKAVISSHRSIFSGKDRTARFLDEVVLDLDNMRITGPEARFDYDPKSDMVKSVYVSGGARVSDTEKWATAQNVSVDFEKDRFVFRGHPRVVQNNDELRGEEIVFLDGGKRVQVRSARAKVDQKHMERNKP